MMNDGFVRVATASPLTTVADPDHNAAMCEEAIRKAAQQGAHVVALPEMVLTSYIANDLLYHTIVLEGAENALKTLVRDTADLNVLFSVGLPLCINGKTYNTLAICYRGRILGVVPKTFIPTYGVDFEGRWFEPGPAEVSNIVVAGQENVPFGSHQIFRNSLMPQMCLGFEICEDIWSPKPPSIDLALAGATILINGSASNASLNKDVYRRGLISGQSARLLACYMYCSSGTGDSTGDVTVGGQEIIAENGTILAQAEPFGSGFAIADVNVDGLWDSRRGMSSFHVAATAQDAGYAETLFSMEISEAPLIRPVSRTPFMPASADDREDSCALAFKMQAYGLLARINHQHARSLYVDAMHGSVQNAMLAMLVAAQAAKLAGSRGSSPLEVHVLVRSSDDAIKGDHEMVVRLAKSLGCEIDESADLSNRSVASANESLRDAYSSIYIDPCDLTELALGLAQPNHCAMPQYAVNSQMVRSLVPAILEYLARDGEADKNAGAAGNAGSTDAPDKLTIPADAQSVLRSIPVQQDSVMIADNDGTDFGPAEVVDFFIDGLLRAQQRPRKLLRLAVQAFAGTYDEHELFGWMNDFYTRFFATQFMRYSLPDGPRIGSAGLDFHDGFMYPSHAQATLWRKELEEIREAL